MWKHFHWLGWFGVSNRVKFSCNEEVARRSTHGEWLRMKSDCHHPALLLLSFILSKLPELLPVLLLLIFVCRIFYLPTKLSAHEMIRKFTCSTRNLSTKIYTHAMGTCVYCTRNRANVLMSIDWHRYTHTRTLAYPLNTPDGNGKCIQSQAYQNCIRERCEYCVRV